jgi:cytochrome c-type biogenesis protein CcmF
MFGVAGLMAWEQEDIRVAYEGEPYGLGAYEFTLLDVRDERGPNYFTTIADVQVTKDGRDVALLQPEKRMYPVAGMPTTEAAIDYRILRDVYIALGDEQADGGVTIRTYIKPLTNWIWMGSLLMALGGCFSIFDRRYRVAAGARKTPQGVPAE